MLYSLIMDFEGGTYVSQGHGNTELEGLTNCVVNLDEIEGLDTEDIISEISDDVAIEIDGMESVWCFSALYHEKLVLMHLVATIG